jgi:hypothetical protein
MNRRFLVASLLLLGLTAGPAAADFLLIEINLEAIQLPQLGNLMNQGGTPGAGGFPGGAGLLGGMPGGGMPGGGMPQGMGAVPGFNPAMMQGMRGGGGMRGGAGGMNMRGMQGQMPGMQGMNRGGQGQMPGGRGGQNPQAQAQAQMRAQRQQQAQAKTAQKQGNKRPPANPNPAAPTNPNAQQDEAEPFDPTLPYVKGFVEFKVKSGSAGAPVAEIETRYGSKTVIPLHPKLKGSIRLEGVQREPFKEEFAKTLKRYVKDKDAEKIVRLAQWALAHGLTRKEEKQQASPLQHALDELAKIDPKHKVIKNAERVRDLLKKTLPDTDPEYRVLLDEMQKEGYRAVPSAAGHFTLLSNLPPTPQTEAILRRRLFQLEEALDNFYLWFALQADLPQPNFPTSRLAAVFISNATEFYTQHAAWGAPAMAASGFTPRRENVIMLSGRPLDDDYNDFAKQMDSLLQTVGVSRDELLTGNVWTRQDIQQDWNKKGQVVYLQTLNLLQRILEDESEQATATHEVTRQLLVASGMFPRHVQVPDWVLSGLASYFETPVGAVYRGVGLPSWSNLIALKHYRDEGVFPKPSDVLYSVLTDRYFHTAQHSMHELQANKDSDLLQDKAHEDAEIARCTSWALVYYLAQNKKLGHIIRYGQELNKLPRDLDLDEKALQACFARAFDLSDPKDARRLDPARLQTFADAWFSDMQSANLELPEVEQMYMNLRNGGGAPDKKDAPATPQGN